jgi:hypothetical protein
MCTTTLILFSFNFFTHSSKHSKVCPRFINFNVFSCILCSPSSIVKLVLVFNSFKYSKHSSLIASGLVPIFNPTTLGILSTVSYFSFNILTGA